MKKEITLGQLLSVAATIIVALATGWISQNNKVSRLEEQVRSIQNEQYSMQLANDKKFDKIDSKIDAIGNDTRAILVQLEKKADRK